MKRAIAFFLILAPLAVGGGPAWGSPAKAAAEELDFRPYVHGKVRRNSYSFFCLMETGGRHIVGLLNRYLAGELSNDKVGEEIRKKAVVYKCARQYLTHMSTETLIRAKTPDFESFDGRLIQITKDSSLVKAQTRNGLLVYVVTNARVPLLKGEKPPEIPEAKVAPEAFPEIPGTANKSGPDKTPQTGTVPEAFRKKPGEGDVPEITPPSSETGAVPEAEAAPETVKKSGPDKIPEFPLKRPGEEVRPESPKLQSPGTAKKSGPDIIPEFPLKRPGDEERPQKPPEAGAVPEAGAAPETGTVPETGEKEKTRAKIDGGETGGTGDTKSRTDEPTVSAPKEEKKAAADSPAPEAGAAPEEPREDAKSDSPFGDSAID